MCIFLSSFLLILQSTQVIANEPKVTLKFGEVRGSCMTTLLGHQLSAFRGIPYAKPPIGKLRFRPPEKWTEKWSTQPFDASQETVECFQTHSNGTYWVGQEDCLILNVYTLEVPKDIAKCKKMPVMMYIHGGGFSLGSSKSTRAGPGKILDHNVVLVTCNYRLGVLGFLSMGNKTLLAGNYALFDQVEALRWVQENIQAFGGDPNQVTIFGDSAGAACVGYHVLSTLSTGLFRAAIIMSGHTFNWAFDDNPKIVAEKIIAATNCQKENEDEIFTCLQAVSLESLFKASSKTTYVVPFRPVVDGKFITDSPINLYLRHEIANKVPVMVGTSKKEGIALYELIYGPRLPKYSDEFISKTLVKILHLDNVNQLGTAEDLVKKRYFQSFDTGNSELFSERLMDIIGDETIKAPTYYMVGLYVKNAMMPYLFSLDYVTDHSIAKPYGLNISGATHADELFFLFVSPELYPFDYNRTNDENEAKFLDLWINFASYSNPTPGLKNECSIKWEPVRKDYEYVYHLDNPITFSPLEGGKSLVDFWIKDIPNSLKK